MKRIYLGFFLAISSFPAGFVAAALAFQFGVVWNIPDAFGVAASVSGVVLGLALFIFMSGLVTNHRVGMTAPNGDAWTNQK